MNVSKRKAAEAAYLARTGAMALRGKKKVKVNFLPDGDDNLGYTREGSSHSCDVFVAWYNDPYFTDLSTTEQTMLRMGIATHELLHQCFTNFEYTKILCESMSQAEAAVFMQFANTLEDPAIEYFAPVVFGGRMLDSLRFSIKRIYNLSPGIDKSTGAFQQLINALINFGDLGVVKGHFTFPEAEDIFCKIAPLYNEGIVCPDSKKRLDIAKECMEIARPLWEQAIKDQELLERFISELLEMLKKNGLPIMDEGSMPESMPSSPVDENRQKIIVKCKKKNAEAVKESDDSKADTSADDNADNEDDTNDGKSDNGVDDADTPDAGKNNEDEDESDADESENDASSDDDQKHQSQKQDQKAKVNDQDLSEFPDGCGEIGSDEDEANAISDETFEITDDVLSDIEEKLEKEEKNFDKIKSEEKESPEIDDFNIDSKLFLSGAKCSNIYITPNSRLAPLCAKIKDQLNPQIRMFKRELGEIFKDDVDEEIYATSGKYNIKRGMTRTTCKVFDKMKDPNALSDVAVMLCIDNSGSMEGSKIVAARNCAIILSETFADLHIPCYVMGYTTANSREAVHRHYVTWKSSKAQRQTLVTMEADWGNFDSYSIRYATKVLEKKQSTHKLLIVISDGTPSDGCPTYTDCIKDTVMAVKEAKKVATVFGIAIGDCDSTCIRGMYKNDYIHVSTSNELTKVFCKKLKKLIKHE